MAGAMDLTCCMGNTIEYEENTYKKYYFPSSDDEDASPYPVKRAASESLDEFFEETTKKKKTVRASNVGRATQDGMNYISTNEDDGAQASHLIKIEIIDLKKVDNISPQDYWKHADARVKYYVRPTKQSDHHQKTRQLIYNITKEIAESAKSKKYTFKEKDSSPCH